MLRSLAVMLATSCLLAGSAATGFVLPAQGMAGGGLARQRPDFPAKLQALVAPGLLGVSTGVRSRVSTRVRSQLPRMMTDATELDVGPYQYSVDKVSCYKGGVDQIRKNHERLLPHLDHIRQQEFFRLFAVDLLSSCTYMPTEDAPCEMDKCEIECADDVRDEMRARDREEHDFRLDGWVRWDMPGDFTDYYDLVEEPERWTEYDGRKVWKFIHERICFQVDINDPENAWKRDFNRAISGLHTSVSAHILDNMMEQKGWTIDSDEAFAEYKRRISDVPEAVANLHFSYMIMLCAIHEAAPRLNDCGYMGTGDKVLPAMRALNSDPLLKDPDVQKAVEAMRRHASSPEAKVWKARLRTRDLLGAMNCVQCNLCRLHGKVAALGLAVGLQVLLGQEDATGYCSGGNYEKLHRVELAGMLTTAAKFGRAVQIVNQFERRRLGSLGVSGESNGK